MRRFRAVAVALLSLLGSGGTAQDGDVGCITPESCQALALDRALALTGPQDIAAFEAVTAFACEAFDSGWACMSEQKRLSDPSLADPISLTQIAEYFRRGCATGDGLSCEFLGFSSAGEAALPAPSAAYQTLEEQCDDGMEAACYTLTFMVRADRFGHYEDRCVFAEDDYACTLAALSTIPPNSLDGISYLEEGVHWLIGQCYGGILSSCVQAHSFREMPWYDTSPLFEEAGDLVAFACREGHALACMEIVAQADRDTVSDMDGPVFALVVRTCELGLTRACRTVWNIDPGRDVEMTATQSVDDCLRLRSSEACDWIVLRQVEGHPLLQTVGAEDVDRSIDALLTLVQHFD